MPPVNLGGLVTRAALPELFAAPGCHGGLSTVRHLVRATSGSHNGASSQGALLQRERS